MPHMVLWRESKRRIIEGIDLRTMVVILDNIERIPVSDIIGAQCEGLIVIEGTATNSVEKVAVICYESYACPRYLKFPQTSPSIVLQLHDFIRTLTFHIKRHDVALQLNKCCCCRIFTPLKFTYGTPN